MVWEKEGCGWESDGGASDQQMEGIVFRVESPPPI